MAGHEIKNRHIVAGQYVGIAILCLISILASIGLNILPSAAVSALGLLPIAIGLGMLWKRYVKKSATSVKDNATNVNDDALVKLDDDDMLANIEINENNRLFKWTRVLLPAGIAKVAAVTLANGSDNLAIYIPFFANMSWTDLTMTLSIYACLVGLWCFIAFKIAEHEKVKASLERYGHVVVPFVLIVLGLSILF
jgi:cadmium resistance protein CadD (predicted permease)